MAYLGSYFKINGANILFMLPRRTDFASPPCLGNANHYFSKSRRPATRRTTKPRPTRPWLSAGRTCPIHTRALLFRPQSESFLFFMCFRRSLRRGSVRAVTFLYTVRLRRLTRLIVDPGGGITTTRKRQIFKNVAGLRGEKCRRRGSWPSRRSSRCRPSRRSVLRPACSATF